MPIRRLTFLALATFACAIASKAGQPTGDRINNLVETAKAVLSEALQRERGWTKIHAGDALIAVGEAEMACREARRELAGSNLPYRIGLLRILSAGSPTPEERAKWRLLIEEVFLTGSGIDQATALETLCKLGWTPSTRELSAVRAFPKTASEADTVLSWWALYLAGESSALEHMAAALDSGDDNTRLIAAYGLRRLNVRRPEILYELRRAADREPVNSASYPYIVGAVFTLGADSERSSFWQTQLEHLLDSGPAPARSEACQALMRIYGRSEAVRFEPFLRFSDAEVRIAAAWAILFVLEQRG